MRDCDLERYHEQGEMPGLENAIDKRAALELGQLMSNLSEDTYAAGWLIGLEYALWSEVYEGGDRDMVIGERTFFELLSLSIRSGGWWYWPEGAPNEVFLTFDQWIEHLDTRKENSL